MGKATLCGYNTLNLRSQGVRTRGIESLPNSKEILGSGNLVVFLSTYNRISFLIILVWLAKYIMLKIDLVLNAQVKELSLLNNLLLRIFSWFSSFHQSESQIIQEQKIIELTQGNPRYFAAIYEKYYEQIYYFIFKRIGDTEISADVTSRVFMKCLDNIHKYKFMGKPFSSWLYRIAINEVNQYFRRKKDSDRCVDIESTQLDFFFEEINFDDSIGDPADLVKKLLEKLDVQELEMIELRFFESRSFKEIAEMLDLTEVNAKVKTYRIVKRLTKIAAELNLRLEE